MLSKLKKSTRTKAILLVLPILIGAAIALPSKSAAKPSACSASLGCATVFYPYDVLVGRFTCTGTPVSLGSNKYRFQCCTHPTIASKDVIITQAGGAPTAGDFDGGVLDIQ